VYLSVSVNVKVKQGPRQGLVTPIARSFLQNLRQLEEGIDLKVYVGNEPSEPEYDSPQN
jgi:hypothetical protein